MEVRGHVEVGDHCRFRNNVILRTTNEGKIIFADRSGASYNVILEATKLIQIGTYTGIAENTVIRDTNHMVYGTLDHWRYTPHEAEPIIIGAGCLIGSHVYIGPGVVIGNDAVIGHGSIVTSRKPIGDGEIWAGAPARFVAHRTKNLPESILKRQAELTRMYGVREDRYKSPVGSSAPADDIDN